MKPSVHVLALLGLVTLGFISALLWVETSGSFPHLEPGLYAGEFRPVRTAALAKVRRFWVFQSLASGAPVIGWTAVESHDPAQRIRLNVSTQEPATLVVEGEEFQLVGTKVRTGVYEGQSYRRDSAGEGEWALRRIGQASVLEVPGTTFRVEPDLVRQLMSMSARESELRRERSKTEAVTQMMSALLASKSSDETTGDGAPPVQRTESETKARALSYLTTQLEKLTKVSDAGQLVSLGREIVTLDRQWAQLRVVTPSEPKVDLGAESLAGEAQ